MTVTDTLLMEAAAMTSSVAELPDAIRKELSRFCEETFEHADASDNISFEVATGKPAVEILRIAHDRPADVIVMSTHGLTGMRKLFFGSTTERVLRETSVPVLLTPAHDRGPLEVRSEERRVGKEWRSRWWA